MRTLRIPLSNRLRLRRSGVYYCPLRQQEAFSPSFAPACPGTYRNTGHAQLFLKDNCRLALRTGSAVSQHPEFGMVSGAISAATGDGLGTGIMWVPSCCWPQSVNGISQCEVVVERSASLPPRLSIPTGAFCQGGSAPGCRNGGGHSSCVLVASTKPRWRGCWRYRRLNEQLLTRQPSVPDGACHHDCEGT